MQSCTVFMIKKLGVAEPFLLASPPTIPRNNNMLCSARNPIECAFGRLKARWGFLTRKIDLELDLVPPAIYACFILHNICEQQMNNLDPQLVQNQEYSLERNQ